MNKLMALLQIGLLSLVCAILFIVGYQFDIFPLESRLLTAQQTHSLLKKQLHAVDAEQFLLEEKMARLPEVKNLLTTWQSHSIRERDLTDLIKIILKMSRAHHLQMNYINAGEKQVQGQSVWIPVNVIAVGEYGPLNQFIAEIAELPWLVMVDDFTVTVMDESHYSAEMQLRVYTASRI